MALHVIRKEHMA